MHDANTDRDNLNPYEIHSRDLNKEIRAAIDKLWQIGFKHDAGDHDVVLTITRNARLLVLLGRQADEQTQRIVSLTKALLWLTAALAVLTFFLAAIAWHTDERIKQIHEISKDLQAKSPSKHE